MPTSLSPANLPAIDNFRGDYAFLSNFYASRVRYDGLVFPSSEAAFQAMKCTSLEERIAFTQMSAPEAKKAGRAAQVRPGWNEIKIHVMQEVVHAKFAQALGLQEKLLATGDRVLIEGNWWNDQFWGVCRGAGSNWLGVILMCERDYWRAWDKWSAAGYQLPLVSLIQ